MLKDVAYQIAHARLLELDGHDRRQGVVLARRSVRRRQGCSRRRSNAVSHGCRAGALPQRQRHQHREEGMRRDAPKSLFARRARMTSLSRASRRKALADQRARVREGRRDARQHRQRLERQHALRRRTRSRRQRRHHRHHASRSPRPSASAARRRTTNVLDDAIAASAPWNLAERSRSSQPGRSGARCRSSDRRRTRR